MHVMRLSERLDERGFDWTVLDPYSNTESSGDSSSVVRMGGNILKKLYRSISYVRLINPDLIHLHVSAMRNFIFIAPLLYFLWPKRLKKVITVHSGSFVFALRSMGPIRNRIAKKIFTMTDRIIVVGSEQKQELVKKGVSPKKIAVVPAFIPPLARETERVATILEGGSARELLVTSGYGLPLYGYHHVLDAYKKEPISSRFRLIICLYNTYDEAYVSGLEAEARKFGDITIVRDLAVHEFAYLLKNASAYIRATDRDGDAVAIREADYYGLSVIASDVVVRPDFCSIFKLGDTNRLVDLIEGLSEPGSESQSVSDNLDKIANIYQDLIDESA